MAAIQAAREAHKHASDVESEFPMLCNTCLGDNPYVRMTREPMGRPCKICERGFTIFRWRPGGPEKTKFKKTEVCRTCARIKNVCQTCLLDLEYGLPVQVRDAALRAAGQQQALAESDHGKAFQIMQAEKAYAAGQAPQFAATSAAANPQVHETLAALARSRASRPQYQRNRARICSFFVRGECTRGATCPYRHEMPKESDLSVQRMKDRYYGHDDPVAIKMLARVKENASRPKPSPPDNQSITTLYVGSLPPAVTQAELRAEFSAFGVVTFVKHLAASNCAFVVFQRRADAEVAMDQLWGKLTLHGSKVTLQWGRPNNKSTRPSAAASSLTKRTEPYPTASTAPAATASTSQTIATSTPLPLPPAPPGSSDAPVYPSADPRTHGAV